MSSDVNEGEEDSGRYRGFDLDDADANDDEIDNTYDTTSKDRRHNNLSSDIGNSVSVMQARVQNQARTITSLKEKHKIEIAKLSRQANIEEVESLRKTISEQAETIAKLKQDLENREDDSGSNTGGNNETKKRKRDDYDEVMNLAMVADSFEKDEKIRELTDEINKLKQDLQKCRTAQNKPSVADKKTEIKSRILPETPVPNLQTLFDEMNTKMEQQMTQIKEMINTSIDEKIGKQISQPENLTYASKTATGILKNDGNELRSFMIEAKNEEIVIEQERQRRERNIVIHGVQENNGLTEDRKKESDQEFVNSLFQILGVSTKPKTTTRLGKTTEANRTRPLKLVMNSIDDKLLIMARLSNLKTAEDKYKRISIKDDYTPEERSVIKAWSDKANELNKNEETTEWKVRGTPKNGLRLVKIKSRQATELHQVSSGMDTQKS